MRLHDSQGVPAVVLATAHELRVEVVLGDHDPRRWSITLDLDDPRWQPITGGLTERARIEYLQEIEEFRATLPRV